MPSTSLFSIQTPTFGGPTPYPHHPPTCCPSMARPHDARNMNAPTQAAHLRQFPHQVHLDGLPRQARLSRVGPLQKARVHRGRFLTSPAPGSHPLPVCHCSAHITLLPSPCPSSPHAAGTCFPPTSGLTQTERQSTAWALDATGSMERARHARDAQCSGRCLTPVSSWSRRVRELHFRHLNSREVATGWMGVAATTVPCTATILPIK